MNVYPFEQIPLEYTDLCPELSTFTVSFHYEGHYRKYTETLNSLIQANPQYKNVPIERLVNCRDETLRFNAGGYYNHGIYFSGMTKGGRAPSENMRKMIEKNFGSMDEFFSRFRNGAMNIRGSGYVWLCLTGNCLKIGTTANQNTPAADRMRPLLCCDVWEHAYYLDYQNRKQEYIDAWFRVIDWKKAEERLKTVNS